MIDHAKSLLSSLIDKRAKNDVICRTLLDPGYTKAEILLRSYADLLYNPVFRISYPTTALRFRLPDLPQILWWGTLGVSGVRYFGVWNFSEKRVRKRV